MLISNKLPHKFWSQGVNMSCYIRNKFYLKPNTRLTPYEIWKRKTSSVSYFHIFGMCYILHDKEYKRKLDHMIDERIFIGC